MNIILQFHSSRKMDRYTEWVRKKKVEGICTTEIQGKIVHYVKYEKCRILLTNGTSSSSVLKNILTVNTINVSSKAVPTVEKNLIQNVCVENNAFILCDLFSLSLSKFCLWVARPQMELILLEC